MCEWRIWHPAAAKSATHTQHLRTATGSEESRRETCCFLLLFFFRGCSGFCLLFYQQGGMLLTKAKGTSSRQKLSICGRFATRITASNMGFHGFHKKSVLLSVYLYYRE